MKKNIIALCLYIIFNFILFVLIFSIAFVIEIEQKSIVANTITNLVRESYLTKELRAVTRDLEKSKTDNFSFISLCNSKGEEILQTSNTKILFPIKIKNNIWSDAENKNLKGILIYYFSPARIISTSFEILFGSLFISIPIYIIIVILLRKYQNQMVENEKIRALDKFTRQISHDIRSPLTALKQILDNKDLNTEENYKILKKALDRINEIATTHLEYSKDGFLHSSHACDIQHLIEDTVEQKLIEYPDLSIQLDLESYNIECIDSDLKRILSNLINNSYEATSSRKKIIEIKSKTDGKKGILSIIDYGCGIPQNVIDRIGKEEITTKKNGNGIGLLHTIETLLSWNVELNIVKSDSAGTHIDLIFPLIENGYILVDDDELVRITWAAKANKSGAHLKVYNSYESFVDDKINISKHSKIYLDSDLGEQKKGEDLAKQLHDEGFLNISIASGHDIERFKDLSFLKSVIKKTPPF